MNSRRLWTLAIGAAMALAITFVMRPTAVGGKTPTVIEIKGCQKKKPPVKFQHAKHVKDLKASGVTCKTCHHKAGKEKKCSTCHAKPQKGIGTCDVASGTKNPFHKTCIGCHKKMTKGPKKCKECHAK